MCRLDDGSDAQGLKLSVDRDFFGTTEQLAEKGFVLNDTGPQGLKPD